MPRGPIVTPAQILAEFERYESELNRIHASFTRTRDGIHIARGDEPLFRQYARELVDLYNDALGGNSYAAQIAHEYQNGFGYLGAPSLSGVENVLGVVRASLTRLRRNPDLLFRTKAQESLRKKENVFLIHGRDEAKWRELKDIVQSEFRLNPIVLMQQPDAGAKTVVEKFEHYAESCAYAIAIFTPDDEVSSGTEVYLQARPNVIYELGWFCGRLGRGNVMLLLKEGTSIFSDFGGIIQKRFSHNVAERLVEIRKDLEAAGVLTQA
jgi:predicted nucleotide-binding protein